MSLFPLRSPMLTPSRVLYRSVGVLLTLTMLLAAARPFAALPAPSPISAAIAPDFGLLPLSFIPNAGQTDPAVRFQAHGLGGTLFFTPDQVVLSLPLQGQQPTPLGTRSSFVLDHSSSVLRPSSVVRLHFDGANPSPQLTAANRLPGSVNYFIGNDPAAWHTDLPTYGEIVYRDLYPGIDLRYTGTTHTGGHSLSLKGTYTVAPGADPTRIRWRYGGASGMRLDEETGDLLVALPNPSPISHLQSPITEHAPLAWQDIDGRRLPVSARYTIAPDGATVGFALGDYDPAYPLTIDPTLTYSTYLGGGSFDYARSVAVDKNGNAYVVGQTRSADFPTRNPLQAEMGGGPLGDAFVVKLNRTGSALVYATYLGGSHNDSGYGIAVDDEGNAYVTGDTLSADFPTANAAQPVSGGGGPFEGDAFIAKLNPTGSALVYSTYLGGGGDELSYGIALDAQGDAYVTGYTSSTDFPSVRAPQPDPSFPQGLNVYGDAFVTQLIHAGGVYTWGLSTYLGGTDLDVARDIALDSAGGGIYVTGHTRSDDFPTLRAAQPDHGGGSSSGRGDAFVTQVISATGVYTWGYSTYLGGSGNDAGNGVAVDGSGDAYVTGETFSSDFPTQSAFQDTFAGDRDAFVSKVVNAGPGTTWGYSTYLGGDEADIGAGVTVDPGGRVYLTGYTFSPEFPTSDDAYDGSCGTDGLCDSSGGDAFLTVLDPVGDALAYSTFLGGGSTDFGQGIALDSSGDVYVTGYTYSTDFPTTPAAHDQTCGTDGVCNGFFTDAFVAKVTMMPDLLLTKHADPPTNTPLAQGDVITYTLVASNSGSIATDVRIADAVPSGTSYVPGSLTSTLGSPAFVGTQVTVDLPSLATDMAVTATFQVTVTTGLTRLISNQATLTADGVGAQESNTVGHPVQGTGEPSLVFLPLVLKGAGGTPEPPGCAPYLVATIDVGASPRGIALDTSRERAYVANYGSDSLSVIDTSTNSVIHTISGIASANGVVYDAAHDVIWVSNYESGQVTPIDASSLAPSSPVGVGDGPWGVAHDPAHNTIYVANSLDDSVTVIDAETRAVSDTLTGNFDQPFHVAANPLTGRAYVTNFGDNTVAVLDGASLSSIVDLSGGDPATQPYGVAVDETHDLVYVAAVGGHRVMVIGTDTGGTDDQLLGWATFNRGFGDPARPVPLRAITVNPDIGPPGDGGHLWVTTSTVDGSEANQALLIPKGWDGYFSYPAPYDVGENPSDGIAVDRDTDRVYVTSGTTPGTVTVLGDGTDSCLVPFAADDRFELEVSTVQD